MTGKFVILLDGEIVTYNRFDQIPDQFDNLIEFRPDEPPSPHSHEDHELLATFNDKFKELMSRETR
jgi:hypothetical protein